jgi:hypothetical protein
MPYLTHPFHAEVMFASESTLNQVRALRGLPLPIELVSKTTSYESVMVATESTLYQVCTLRGLSVTVELISKTTSYEQVAFTTESDIQLPSHSVDCLKRVHAARRARYRMRPELTADLTWAHMRREANGLRLLPN